MKKLPKWILWDISIKNESRRQLNIPQWSIEKVKCLKCKITMESFGNKICRDCISSHAKELDLSSDHQYEQNLHTLQFH